eukprot:TRINITY_DN30320_c0_g1_i1.p1 TRINITY_DN30320_c0_g1~~TRINITY_DN30320_c0_g1_i1.p1  ORF type:complete len:143 (-),score=29.08 TRINITY_DN30320_c0_g1_i1:132-560(-)
MNTCLKVSCLFVLNVVGGTPDPGAQHAYPVPLGLYHQPVGYQYAQVRCDSLLGCVWQGISNVGNGVVTTTGNVIDATGNVIGAIVEPIVGGAETEAEGKIDGGEAANENAEFVRGLVIGGGNIQRKKEVCFSTTGLFYFYCR